MRITKEMFVEKVGREPSHDDLDRCNCAQAGQVGHYQRGWIDGAGPRFLGEEICDKRIVDEVLDDAWSDPRKRVYPNDNNHFDPVHYSNLNELKFVVPVSDSVIPNFSILPIMGTNEISLVWQDGVHDSVPLAVEREAANHTGGSDLKCKPMCEQVYHEIRAMVIQALNSLVNKAYLYLGFDGIWVISWQHPDFE